MGYLNAVLPVLLYIFGIILLIVLIILGIRMIQIMDKAEKVVDDIQEKVSSLDNAFTILEKTTGSIALISDKVVTSVISGISRIFRKGKKEEDYYE